MTEGYILMDPEEFEKYFKEIKPMLKKHIEEPELITTKIYLQIGDDNQVYFTEGLQQHFSKEISLLNKNKDFGRMSTGEDYSEPILFRGSE